MRDPQDPPSSLLGMDYFFRLSETTFFLLFPRFVISGPVDTPYEGGLFVFDVLLPKNYPVDPPLVTMVTTGQGTVKSVQPQPQHKRACSSTAVQ